MNINEGEIPWELANLIMSSSPEEYKVIKIALDKRETALNKNSTLEKSDLDIYFK